MDQSTEHILLLLVLPASTTIKDWPSQHTVEHKNIPGNLFILGAPPQPPPIPIWHTETDVPLGSIQTRWAGRYLSLLLLRGVEDGGAAHLGQLAALAIEGPAADLVPDHVLDEEDAAVVSHRQPVEQLDVLQQVVVRGAVYRRGQKKTMRDIIGQWFTPLRCPRLIKTWLARAISASEGLKAAN